MILAILFVGSIPLSLHPVGLTNVDLYSKLVRHKLLVKCLFHPILPNRKLSNKSFNREASCIAYFQHVLYGIALTYQTINHTLCHTQCRTRLRMQLVEFYSSLEQPIQLFNIRPKFKTVYISGKLICAK